MDSCKTVKQQEFKKINKINYKNNNFWLIKTNKDIFKNKTKKELRNIAYNYILNGNENFEIIYDIIDNKEIKFRRISANEYTRGRNSQKLSNDEYNKKMRLAPSIDDLVNNAEIKYSSPLIHFSSLFKTGFNNYQGKVKIDNTVFRYIVRIGKAKNDNIFYDVSLKNLNIEKGTSGVPNTNCMSPLNKQAPLTKNNIP